jgi:hypothetical protein
LEILPVTTLDDVLICAIEELGVEIATLTAFISPFLPFLLKLGKKAAEKATETAAGKFGEAA